MSKPVDRFMHLLQQFDRLVCMCVTCLRVYVLHVYICLNVSVF